MKDKIANALLVWGQIDDELVPRLRLSLGAGKPRPEIQGLT